MKKIIKIGTILSISLSPIVVLSCSKDTNNNQHKFKSWLLGEDYVGVKTAKMEVPSIKRNELLKLPASMNAHYGYDLISGGFGELRQYYTNNGKSWHLGQDVIVPSKKEIYAPFNAEVINSIWKNQKGEIALGIGANLTLKVKISDLPIKDELKENLYFEYKRVKRKGIVQKFFTLPKIKFSENGVYKEPTPKDLIGLRGAKIILSTKEKYDEFVKNYTPSSCSKTSKKFLENSSKYIYIAFMHLSKSSIDIWGNAILNSKPKFDEYKSSLINVKKEFKKVKKGDLIGYVGSKNENGGWVSHIHIETFFPSFNGGAYRKLDRVYKWENEVYKCENDKNKQSWFAVKAIGIITPSRLLVKGVYGELNDLNAFRRYATSRSIMDANKIFSFYDQTSPIIKIESTN